MGQVCPMTQAAGRKVKKGRKGYIQSRKNSVAKYVYLFICHIFISLYKVMVHVQFRLVFHFVMNFSKGSKTNVTKVCTGVRIQIAKVSTGQYSFISQKTRIFITQICSSRWAKGCSKANWCLCFIAIDVLLYLA